MTRARVATGLAERPEVELDDERLEPFRAELADEPDAPPVRLAYAAAHVVMKEGYRAAPQVPSCTR